MRVSLSSRPIARCAVVAGCFFAGWLTSGADAQCPLPLVSGYTGYGSSVAVSGDRALVGSSNGVAVFGFDGIARPRGTK